MERVLAEKDACWKWYSLKSVPIYKFQGEGQFFQQLLTIFFSHDTVIKKPGN
jgi:hypothetical protein